jgi:lipopolysaccharide transport system ATP-binding protein
MSVAISSKGLGKAFRRYPSQWMRLAEALTGRPRHQPVWALQDVNFDIRQGETVGLVGENGSGKSTLLKIIAGVLSKTAGSLQVEGEVAAILELGMGFHPDCTGRENARMAAQLLGLSSAEIDRLLPAIIDFAEIGDFIDQPLRVYSSGMQVRLAFSVATARRPAILIVDEALAVGDAYFQHKSFQRIRQFSQEGTTLIIVSHDKAAVQSLCTRAILLEKGRVKLDSTPDNVFDLYNALVADQPQDAISQEEIGDGRLSTRSGTGEAEVVEVKILNAQGRESDVIGVGEPMRLSVRVKAHNALERLVFGFGLRNRHGLVMFGANTWHTGQTISDVKRGDEFVFEVAFDANLGLGNYSIQTALVDGENHLGRNFEWRDIAAVFQVANLGKPPFDGALWLNAEFRVTKS